MTRVAVRPPAWFWIAGTLLLLWAVIGVASFATDPAVTRATVAMTDYDRQLYASRPIWTFVAYGIGTVAGLIGSVALMLRRRDTTVWYGVSLVAVVILFGYMLGFTSLIAVKGFATAALFPIVIALIGVAEFALARHAARRGWIA